ncbi:MAG: rubredoxin reductase, partial [Gammaproteobacteria bacterium]|nr:rubredoxin reductase [Gammaproteobacteria bacterium]
GQRTEVSYPAMPVTIKTTEYPIVSQLPKSPEGSWQVTHSESGIAALCHNQEGELLGYCLSGSEIIQRAALTKQIGPTLA